MESSKVEKFFIIHTSRRIKKQDIYFHTHNSYPNLNQGLIPSSFTHHVMSYFKRNVA